MEWIGKKGSTPMSLLEECVHYLNQPEFMRFIDAWTEKYQSLGHLGGKIQLDNLSLQEQTALGLFLGLDLSCGYLHITYHQFQKQFMKTKFEGVEFIEVLKRIQALPIYTHQEVKEEKNQKIKKFKEHFLCVYHDTYAAKWLEDYFQKDKKMNGYILHDIAFKELLENVCQALNQLPIHYKKYESLPIFAQMITRNPHYFDQGLAKELLLKGIECIFDMSLQQRTVETINEVFYQAGLLRDDLSNQCYICHIRPIKNVSGWLGFYQNYEPWNMNLYNLSQVTSLFLQSHIYIVENPSVFRRLVYEIKNKKMDVGLICSNGQINLCTCMLLNQLVESGCHLYYAGDFDPEGLMIADRLKQRYQEDLTLWCYHLHYFQENAIEQKSMTLKRLQILENIQDNSLKPIAQYIIQNSCFVYQEGLVKYYLENLKS